MKRETLLTFSKESLVDLVLAQQAQIDRLMAEVARLSARVRELEAKLNVPPKTPDNSSLPPSKGQKPDLPKERKKRRHSHPGVARALAENPDRIIDARLTACPHCAQALGAADQPEVHAYDHIDLPPIKPIITRINRYHGDCPCCGRHVGAPHPEGFLPGSPFGPELCALIIHLHITQAISFERLVIMMDEVFGVTISEGAIANILARAEAPLMAAAEPIAQAVRESPVIGSDETSARVGGSNWWQWVLLGSTAICHVIADTRAASVVADFLNGAQPEVWVADRYGGQNGHGAVRQICLAHLLRDAKYAIEDGDDGFAPGFRWLLLRAVAIGKRRGELKDTTLANHHRDLEKRLDRLLSGPMPERPAARRLFRAMRRDRADLFRFVTRRDVPYTNNACERALRPSVIFRKVTGGFRAEWGAKVYAAAASIIATGRLHGRSALAALKAALAGEPVMQSA
ncbi:IS66 family transposase [Acidiphilium acidophilum]|uniref:IS66 family transposase n=1 Tax=Acidiphilium acidophilum TaxID=76588 RepID=UPI002E8E70BC|nr:IS66 family transposase [Acidiphilium acidophilum]MEE3500101.1 IS66 family transposase [Acidiphilium acidophilum]MEE3500659.1 IS66 family transposase [Acidiphilium acidophilum]MEE3501148.1 IS66 family transposase [Acidiphilium acidophilum]MEE3501362.1 IS66 family transposase [Acidiphilium acidophilum]